MTAAWCPVSPFLSDLARFLPRLVELFLVGGRALGVVLGLALGDPTGNVFELGDALGNALGERDGLLLGLVLGLVDGDALGEPDGDGLAYWSARFRPFRQDQQNQRN